ncbi:hypothetical protein BJ508DRAFT_410637 [Ascobolus immersus RN42]|uniref:Cyclin-like protein n=1 Tax=Ascobolus immersus RN42 TaxID=1160509 RepID=A0A3N4IS66_ASCIM|nr:hypothetical protein BJ508DRAFT_410637 [Ascobolus immersus RN42]
MVNALINALATPEQLATSPSQQDGLTPAEEASLKFAGVRLLQLAGELLEMPRQHILTTQILLHRFYLLSSHIAHPLSTTLPAILLLVSKFTSKPLSASLILATTHTLLHAPYPLPPQPSSFTPPPTPPITSVYNAESTILRTLNFTPTLDIQTPHVLALQYLQMLGLLENPVVAKKTLAYLYDAVYSPSLVYLTHPPNMLATAAIYLAAREGGASLPSGMKVAGEEWGWWDVFDVEREELGFLVVCLKGVESVVEREMARVKEYKGWGWVEEMERADHR